jgi:hypothetical protein
MLTDALRVASLDEALNASAPTRRVAARLLLDVMRAVRTDAAFRGHLQTVETRETAEVAKELRALIERYGL